MANDPVLQRSMFQKQGPSVTPAVGLGTGIGSVTTPDQNAQALRNMFQPTVSIGAPTEMLQQPVQSFQEGGLAQLLPSFLRPAPPTEEELARVEQRAAMRRMAIDEQYMDEARQPPRQPLVAQYSFREPRNFRMPPSYLERTDPARFEAERPAREAAAEEARLRAEASLEEQRARYAPEQARYRAMEEARQAGVLATNRARSFDIDDAEARSLTPEARRRLEDDRIVPGVDTLIRPARPGSFALPQSGARQRALEQVNQYPEYEPEIRSRYQEELRTGERAQPVVVPLPRPRPDNLTPSQEAPAPPVDEVVFQTRKEAPPAAAPERQKGSLELTLDGIRSERAAERRENALLALMQAGFAIAGGRSPNAISNIGAGGQAGIAAFAAMERASREDAAARRREAIQLATSERQLALTERQLEKDPEAIRTYALLGGWTPDQGRDRLMEAAKRGFDFMQTKEAPSRAEALLKAAAADPLRGTPGALLSPEEARRLSQFLYGSLTGTLTERGERSGQPAGPQTFRLDELPRSR
jgi:hypothetical protein